MNVSVLGIDIAKNIFQLHGVDSSGKRVLKQRIERDKLSAYVANLSLSAIAMSPVVDQITGPGFFRVRAIL